MQEGTSQYEDIIHLPHHTSPHRAAMPMADRAAQFSPFSALTGYEDVIEETGRLTDWERELTEGSVAALDEKLRILAEYAQTQPTVTVTWFQPDSRKNGGEYVTVTGRVKRVDAYRQMVCLTDGKEIPMEQIYGIQCRHFPEEN